ncbi:pyridoxamine 5'-phosphate oxidase family protein [Streptomyces sp. NPDC051173]|uniref:pyridoxamine 5'-phosphate oxidase family protein n=1 Tax=Streptomyces sp. NPDC051173 TaxID=3155164 RepID=UPI00344E9537
MAIPVDPAMSAAAATPGTSAPSALSPLSSASAPHGRSSYEPTERTTPTRYRDRASYDREQVHAILDAGSVCHLGFLRDGAPAVLPTLYGRIGDRLYVHGSTGSRPMRDASREEDAGMPVCLTVTHLDGLVLARSAFHHSLNYRSVVVHGTARQVTEEGELRAALDALVNQVVPGRAADSRPPTAKELAATAVLRIDLTEVSAKIRSAGPADDAEDLALPYWSGVVPVTTTYGTPVPADDLAPGIPVPAYVTAL